MWTTKKWQWQPARGTRTGDGGKRGTTRTWQQRQHADHNGDQATTQQRWGRRYDVGLASMKRREGREGHDAGHDVAMVVVVEVAMVVATMCEGGGQDKCHESTTPGWCYDLGFDATVG